MGTWSSSNTSVATVIAGTGVVAGVTAGTATISYTVAGCFVTVTVTVNPTPPAISGPPSVCMGNTITLSDAMSGGTWSSLAPSVATVGGGTGIVTPMTPGVAPIFYLISSTGCFVIANITVNPPPAAITGNTLTCVGSTTTLADISTGGIWSSSNTLVAIAGTSSGVISGTSGGTAVITYTLGTGCMAVTTVTVVGGACSPCAAFSGGFSVLGSGGVISLPVTAGNYYLPNNVLISSIIPTTIANAVIFIEPGVTIDVDAATNLTLNSSHLFSCSMWQGIVLDYAGTTSSAQLSVKGGSLIEDANVAVLIQKPVTPVAGNIFESDDAVFNRNTVGVDIEDYTSALPAYPFVVRNTVFTSRDMEASMWPGYYPTSWPSTNGSTGLKFPYSTSDPFVPPFNTENPTGSPAGGYFPPVACKNGNSAYCGIKLENVGSEVLGGPFIAGTYFPTSYSDIVIGDDGVTPGNLNQNLFDNMMVGIYANVSDVTSINNAFTNMIADLRPSIGPSVPSGDGIYANSLQDFGHLKRLRAYSSPGSTYKNLFYNFLNGVECYNYFQVIGQKCSMINKLVPGFFFPPTGQFGYRLSSDHYDGMDISNNTISNVNTGISFWATLYPGLSSGYYKPVQQYTGALKINNNIIQAHPWGLGPWITNEAVQMGISVQNVLSATTKIGPSGSYTLYYYPVAGPGTLANVDGNTINDAYNGIYVNSYIDQAATSNANTISVRARTSNSMQFGINHTLDYQSTIYQNTVSVSAGTIALDFVRAFFASNNTAVNVACNQESNTGRGYEFYGANVAAAWQNNTMQNNNEGFVLNGGLIGRQPHAGSMAIGNQWLGSWPASHPQTYVYHGSDAILSPIYVLSYSADNPTNNYGDATIPHYNGYDASLGSINVVSGSVATCPPPYPAPPGDDVSLFEDMVRQNIVYSTNTMPKKWMNQYALWKTILMDTTLVDSSAAIAQFADMAVNSRYAYLTNIESCLANGDYDSAAILLSYNIDTLANTDTDAVTGVRMADSIAADNIVENYQKFYTYFIKYIDTSLTHEDSIGIMALAQLCPHINGTVVFQARALYSFIYNDLSMFNDDSCLDADTVYRSEWRRGPTPSVNNEDGNGQQYKLFPNPTDGDITLRQFVQDTGLVRIEISDMVGRSIYKENLLFSSKTAKLRLANVIPGMYLLQLSDSEDRVFRIKFVKE